MSAIITVEHLSKRYNLGQIGARTFRDSMERWLGKPTKLLAKRWGASSCSSDGELWALRDVTFDVQPGEVLGIIGRNGAGKSTLLKILSRITEPTSGRSILRGRVASLLEVGTGFHPELTGRENIFLNGAILGMRKAEILRKFDDILAFSEVEKFIDTPVKRYSSGMYVRLAFAVAAHLEPEILIVDEVLAVGDAQFQKKCLGKMGEVSKQGRTVLFVSHNMAAVMNLCSRVILLQDGKIGYEGSASGAVARYMRTDGEENKFVPGGAERSGDQRATIMGFEVQPNPPRTGSPVTFAFKIRRNSNEASELQAEVAIAIHSERFGPLCHIYSRHVRTPFDISSGESIIEVEIPSLPLAPGRYQVNLWLGSGRAPVDWIRDCFLLTVHPGRIGDEGAHIETNDYPVVVQSTWRTKA